MGENQTTQAQPQAPAQPAPENPEAKPLETVTPKGVVAGREILKRIDLYTPGAYIVALMNPKGDLLEKMAKDGIELNTNKMAPYLIREWNFLDEKGEALPITIENVGIALSFQDNQLLLKELGFADLFPDAKKNS